MAKKILIGVLALLILSLGLVNAAKQDSGFENGKLYFLQVMENEDPSFVDMYDLLGIYLDCCNACWYESIDCQMGCSFYDPSSQEYSNCMGGCSSSQSSCERGCGWGYFHASCIFGLVS